MKYFVAILCLAQVNSVDGGNRDRERSITISESAFKRLNDTFLPETLIRSVSIDFVIIVSNFVLCLLDCVCGTTSGADDH